MWLLLLSDSFPIDRCWETLLLLRYSYIPDGFCLALGGCGLRCCSFCALRHTMVLLRYAYVAHGIHLRSDCLSLRGCTFSTLRGGHIEKFGKTHLSFQCRRKDVTFEQRLYRIANIVDIVLMDQRSNLITLILVFLDLLLDLFVASRVPVWTFEYILEGEVDGPLVRWEFRHCFL